MTVAALPVIALALFYPVENWRGKQAWEKCQRELKAKGEVLEWDAYIPPPVPDEQNVFKAPHMAEWFVGRGTNEFARRLGNENLKEFCRRFHTNVVVEVTVVALNEKVDARQADMVLRYDPPFLTRATEDAATVTGSARIPLIQFQDVPLRVAIESLARQAGSSFTFDHELNFDNPANPEPGVTCRWHDVTAEQALLVLLNMYNLQWTKGSKTGVDLISRNKSERTWYVYAGSDDLMKETKEMIEKSILPVSNKPPDNQRLKTPQGFEIASSLSRRTKPSRVVIKVAEMPRLIEVAGCFPSSVVLSEGETMGLRVEGSNNCFQVFLSSPPFTASEYLSWSDQFVPEFDMMRTALQRPKTRMEVVCVKFSKLDFMVASWVNRGGAKLASPKLVCAAGRASCRYRYHGLG